MSLKFSQLEDQYLKHALSFLLPLCEKFFQKKWSPFATHFPL